MGLVCSSCGFQNIQGVDRCEECLHSLMQRDLPRAKKDDPYQTVMLTAPVSELLTGKDLLVASVNDPISKVVKIFQKDRKKCVLVYKAKKLVGILSTRDLLKKVASEETQLSKLRVEQVMTPNPEFLNAEDPIAMAVNKMAMGGFRNLPVLAKDGAPISIITIQDVLSYLAKRDKSE